MLTGEGVAVSRVEPDIRKQIETLGREVYGDDFEKFLATPRRSLDWATPATLIERDERQPVLAVLTRMADGNFA
jgi:hypothetical protein